MHTWLVRALIGVALIAAARPPQDPVRIRLGTVVPQGSLWEESLHYLRQEWHRISNGAVKVTIHAGGVLGDETEMVRQVTQGRIQAVGLSSVGLSRIDEGVSCLQVPMMFRSYDELDYVRDRLAATFEQRIEARGFKVLNWADGGWVYVFSRKPVRSPDDLKSMKLFTSAGDPDTERLYKKFGFRVVPLSMADLSQSLGTGLIEAFATVPLFAQLEGTYKLAPHMLDVRWTPLVGGTVISRSVWESLPAAWRPALFEAARASGGKLRGSIRKLGDDAVVEMEKRGLRVTRADAATEAAWQAAAEATYQDLRGPYCPADLFDDVKRLRDEFRKAKGR
jgi:TRAP-type C4-dicarboxylate transport system substrate-binding protein